MLVVSHGGQVKGSVVMVDIFTLSLVAEKQEFRDLTAIKFSTIRKAATCVGNASRFLFTYKLLPNSLINIAHFCSKTAHVKLL